MVGLVPTIQPSICPVFEMKAGYTFADGPQQVFLAEARAATSLFNAEPDRHDQLQRLTLHGYGRPRQR